MITASLEEVRMKTRRLVVLAAVVGLSMGVAAECWAQRTPVDQYGRDCISGIRGAVKEQGGGVYGHYVYATNSCNRTINLSVCYEGTSSCSNLTARPGSESFTTLGVKRGVRHFNYEWGYERF
jgi:hypothetical protein